MFDSRAILDLLDTRAPGHSLPQPFYNDPALFEFDLAAVFGRSWLMVGFEAELPKTGSFFAFTIARTPIIVLRDRSGDIRAFHNVCIHRGAQICAEGHGRNVNLVCPYHQWTYDLNGALISANRMKDIDPSTQHLRPIRVELLAGCIYVCLSNDPPAFQAFRAVVEPMLAPHKFCDAKVAYESTLVEKANWKLVMENARECYHCSARHSELSFSFPTDISDGYNYGEDERVARFGEQMAKIGFSAAPVNGDWWQAVRFPLNPGSETISADGKDVVAKRMVDVNAREIGSMWWAIEPHNFCHALPDYAFMFSAFPNGPQETIVRSKWLVHKDAIEGVDYTLEDLTKIWNKTNLQDRDLVENNQRGVNSQGYRPGRYSEEAETLVLRFVDWYAGTAREVAGAHDLKHG